MLKKLSAVGLGLLATMAVGVPGAFAKSVKATAPIQEGNGFCGSNEEADPVIGTVKFTRTGNTVKFAVKLAKGLPNTKYGVDIAARPCELLTRTGEFTTNKKGIGHSKGSIEVPSEDTEFFADIDPNGFAAPPFADTPFVSLP
jgi:hypothetical protein